MISDVRRDAIFEEMDTYLLSLDPTASGPRYFIDKIAICRNYLNNVSLVLSELQREKLVASSELGKRQAILELEGARLLTTDEQVRRMANIKDRESMVSHMLREHRQRIDLLKDQIHTIDGLLKHVSLRNRELHATMDAIKSQRRFMQIEVLTGAFYGDERGSQLDDIRGVDLGSLPEESATEEAIVELADFSDPGAPPSSKEVPKVVEEPAPETVEKTPDEDSDEAAIHRFFGDLKADPPHPEKNDTDILLFLENV